MRARVVTGRAGVARELHAATPLVARIRAPVPAQAPWLTAVLWSAPRRALPWVDRPVAVVVDRAAAAFLSVRRRGRVAVVTALGQEVRPRPGGRPHTRLPAADDGAAELLAAGILDLLGSLRGPWELRLAGLPLGDPTLRALARALPTAVLANVRSSRLVDELDGAVPGLRRSRDPRELERRLPLLLAREPDPGARAFLRTAARVHAAIGRLELAVASDGDRLQAVALTLVDGLVDGADRWTWWGSSDVGGLREEIGAPLVTLTARRE